MRSTVLYKSHTNKINRFAFKKRVFKKKQKKKIIWGNLSLLSSKQQRIEGVYISKIILKLKKQYKKYKKQHRPRKAKPSYWIKYNINTELTKKAKNARMGSGKGKYVRNAFTVFKNTNFIEFKKTKIKAIRYIKNYFWLKFGVDLIINTN